ncbi:MAG: O-acetylhomoserine aminocarboxypropyltransferase/cysteine synthase [Ruminococcaceae bacterium]|nr:O-acetylhomoserine aminocarboxypropyltransferase/cysteine synthase [Oscillospiraceae bacterium]
MSDYKIETKCVQGAYKPANGEPRVMPIYQSTTYKYESADHLGQLFDLKAEGHMYSRISNPSLAYLEDKIAMLEGGVGAMFTSSGQAANMMAVLNITSSGQNIVSLSSIYGGTINLFAVTMKRMGVEVRFITPDMSDEEAEKYIDENTRLIFGETIANPALTVLDIKRYADLAHRHGLPMVVDNTFATPILCKPFEYGADIVVHSTTKYMDGHAQVVGGVVVDSGNFNWENGKFPELCEPDESYHGVIYTKDFGKAAFIAKARVQLMRDFGSIPTAISAFMVNTSLETLHLRMERHSENALKVARFLESNEKIGWVNYPLLESSPDYALAKKYLPKGASGVISFGVKGGRQAAVKFMDSLKLAAIVVHVADARTSVLHPASTTHRQLTDEQLVNAGITPDLVRMSVGIENADDIIDDIKQALEAIM